MPLQIGMNAVRLSRLATLPRPWFGNTFSNWPCSPCSCPTFTADLAPLVRRLAAERRAGVFHATNQGAVSWYEFVRDVVAAAGAAAELADQPVEPTVRLVGLGPVGPVRQSATRGMYRDPNCSPATGTAHG